METKTVYVCEFCGEEFSVKNDAIAHERTHPCFTELTPVWNTVNVTQKHPLSKPIEPIFSMSGKSYPGAVICTFSDGSHIVYRSDGEFVKDISDFVTKTFPVRREDS